MLQSSESTADLISIKIEEGPLSPTTEPSAPSQPQERHSMSSTGKRKRTSAVRYAGLDLGGESDSEYVSQRVKVEISSDVERNEIFKPKSRTRKAHIGHYQEICRYFQKVFANLIDPKRIPGKVLLESYKRSWELNTYMKEEYDERQEEFIKLRGEKLQLNTKLKSLKVDLADERESRKAAEVRASLHEKNYREEKFQLTLKLAQPLSKAQIKLENAHQDYATEMAELRDKLIEERNAKDSVLKDLAIARAEIARQPTGSNVQTPGVIRELHDLKLEISNTRKLKVEFEASAGTLTAANLLLESKAQELEAENANLKVRVDTTVKVAVSETAEKEAAWKEVEELKKKIQCQKAVVENALKFL